MLLGQILKEETANNSTGKASVDSSAGDWNDGGQLCGMERAAVAGFVGA